MKYSSWTLLYEFEEAVVFSFNILHDETIMSFFANYWFTLPRDQYSSKYSHFYCSWISSGKTTLFHQYQAVTKRNNANFLNSLIEWITNLLCKHFAHFRCKFELRWFVEKLVAYYCNWVSIIVSMIECHSNARFLALYICHQVWIMNFISPLNQHSIPAKCIIFCKTSKLNFLQNIPWLIKRKLFTFWNLH